MALGNTGLNDAPVQVVPPGYSQDYFKDLFPRGLPQTSDALESAGRQVLAAREESNREKEADSLASYRQSQIDLTQRDQSLRERAFPLEQQLKEAQINAQGVAAEATRSEIALRNQNLLEAKETYARNTLEREQFGEALAKTGAVMATPDDPGTPAKIQGLLGQYPWMKDNKYFANVFQDYAVGNQFAVNQGVAKKRADDILRLGGDATWNTPAGHSKLVDALNTEVHADLHGTIAKAEYDPDDPEGSAQRAADQTDKMYAYLAEASRIRGFQLWDDDGGLTASGKVLYNSTMAGFQARGAQKVAAASGLVIKDYDPQTGKATYADLGYERGNTLRQQYPFLSAQLRSQTDAYNATLKTFGNAKHPAVVAAKAAMDDTQAKINQLSGITGSTGAGAPATISPSEFALPANLSTPSPTPAPSAAPQPTPQPSLAPYQL